MKQSDTLRTRVLTKMFSSDYAWLSMRLRRKLGCAHIAEDIASETFAQLAAKEAPELIREPRALMTTISLRLVYDLWRRRDLERAYLETLGDQPEGMGPSAEEISMAVESALVVDRALDGLSKKARMAFIYSQFDGLTYNEIALRLGVSASMVRQYIAKALRLCYEALE